MMATPQTHSPHFCINCEHDHFECVNQRDNSRYYPCSNTRCSCRHYIPISDKPENHKKYIRSITKIHDKVKYILENIPAFRELTNKQFVFAFWHYNNNFTTGMQLDARTYLALPDPESITRAKRKCVEENKDLGPTNEKTIDEKLAKEWGILQWVRDERDTEDFT